jgi:hemolysin activation/secretion protein
MNKLLLSSATAISVCLCALSANAQVIPGTTNPGIRQQQLQISPTAPKVSNKPLISVEDGKQTAPIQGGLEFTLKSIAVEGSTAIPQEEIEPLYKDLIGTKISLSTLNKVADDITSFYRNRGFILTRAIIPPQAIKGGDVKIRIVEGFIDSVKIQGDDADDALIKAYGERIRESKPLNVATLERYLLLMEDLPGVEARAVLQPSPTTPGASDIVVNITRKAVDVSATADNRGSHFLGPIQISSTVAVNNLLGLNEQTQARVVATPFQFEELFFGELRHEEQLGSYGTKATIAGSYINTHPRDTLTPFDIVGTSYAFSAGISHPVVRSRRENLFVNTDFTLRNSDLDSLGANLSYDKTRVIGVGASYDFVDFTSAINRAEARYARGLGIGTDVDNQPRSRANGHPVFDKFTGKVSRIQPVTGPWSIFGAASGQYSPDPLVASEEFTLGGAEFGSAYDAAEITGDSGVAGRVELQYNAAPQLDYLSQYQLYGFYDIGRVWNHDPIAGSESNHSELSSAGIGVRYNISEQLSGGFEGAKPLTRDVAATGDNDPHFFFNLQYRY